MIRLDGSSSKQKKLQAGILSSERRAVLDTQYEILSKVGSLCAACEANPVKNNDTDFCLNCDYLIELGRLLNIDDAYIYLNFNEIASLNKTVAIKSDYRYKAGWQAFSVSRYIPGHARISMPYYVPSDENGDVLTFSDISQKADGVKKLGMFKADVDYLGLVFSSSLKERWSLSRYAALSSSFHFFFSEYLLETIKTNYKNLYVVFSGGDDVCVIGPWNEIIRFARDFNELFLWTLGLDAERARAVETQVEQALSAGHGGGKVGAHYSLMLQVGVAGQKQPVVQHHRAAPVGGVQQDEVLIRGLQHQNPVAGILGLDDRFTAGLAPHGLAEQVAHALDAGGGVDVAQHPLHGAGLDGHIGPAQVADQLTLFDVHLGAVVGHRRRAGRDAQVPLVLHHLKGAQLSENGHIVVVGKIRDLIHGFHLQFHASPPGGAISL